MRERTHREWFWLGLLLVLGLGLVLWVGWQLCHSTPQDDSARWSHGYEAWGPRGTPIHDPEQK